MTKRHSSIGLASTGPGGGFLSGLTGVGGGAIMVPLMTGALKMRPHTAHGTSLVTIILRAAPGAPPQRTFAALPVAVGIQMFGTGTRSLRRKHGILSTPEQAA